MAWEESCRVDVSLLTCTAYRSCCIVSITCTTMQKTVGLCNAEEQ